MQLASWYSSAQTLSIPPLSGEDRVASCNRWCNHEIVIYFSLTLWSVERVDRAGHEHLA